MPDVAETARDCYMARTRQVQLANDSGRVPVVFIQGPWLKPSGWDRWAALFARTGYAPVNPGWSQDPGRHYSGVIGALASKPAVVGHSYGGLLAQTIAGRGQSAATVAIAPLTPFLTYEQFRGAFASAVPEDEARNLYATFAVTAGGNVTEYAAGAMSRDRGPLLIICGHNDAIVPRAVSYANYERQRCNPGVTEFSEMPRRGHSMIIDDGWPEVAAAALAFIRRHT
jgi:non-heme chloroperoxidase